MRPIQLFTLLFLVLFALTGIAILWQPRDVPKGKIPLVWSTDNNPARSAQINSFNGENPGLLLRLDYGNTGMQKLLLQCSSGVGPDLMDFLDDQMQTLVEAGILWDVTERAPAMGFSAQESWPAAREEMTIGDRQYAYPCNVGAKILIYNKNVFDAFGVPYPEGLMTWDQFIELAKKFRAPPHGNGPRIYAVADLTWKIIFETMRGNYFSELGEVQIAGSADLKRAFEMHRDLIFKYHLMPTDVEAKSLSGQGGWGLGSLNQFASGRFAMIVTGEFALNAFGRSYYQKMREIAAGTQIADPLQKPLRLGAVLLPHFAGRPPSYRVESRLAGINRYSPRREEALAFLQYLAGPTYSTQVNREADFLPANPRYADLGQEAGPEDLSRPQLHEITVEAVRHGYAMRRSPFVRITDVTSGRTGILDKQRSRMESNPSLPIDELLQTAQRELEILVRRNLERSPDLKKLYVERFGEEAFKNLP